MILGFKKRFVSKILSGEKIHTIREDKTNRWKPGKLIHFVVGLRTKQQKQFKLDKCISIQKIQIKWHEDLLETRIYIDNKELDLETRQKLAKKDGFENLAEFLLFFNKDITRKIIHWTNFTY